MSGLIPLLVFPGLLLLPASAGGEARSRTFVLTCRATIRDVPDGARTLEAWLPLPRSDDSQTIHRIDFDVPGRIAIAREPREGNEMLHLRVDRPGGRVSVGLAITATRREDSGRDEELTPEDRARYLAPEPLVPLDGPVQVLAIEATRGLATDAEKARALYDKVLGTLRYDKSGTGWGRGDALFACDARRGNCTDFHALLIGMARSVGIPARFAIGRPLPPGRGAGAVVGYHCWAELYVRGRGWVPVDSSEAWKDPARRDYFFGHHDESRLELSRGRHLTLAPPQQGPPLNFFVDPYAEVDGRPHAAIDTVVAFEDIEPGAIE